MSYKKPIQISITGGAKSGKTTIMKSVAKYLGIYALSTGDLFRCCTYIWINSKLPEYDVEGRLNEVRKSYIHFGKNYNYFYRRKKITEKIDTFEMSSVTCQLAQNPEFRKIVKDKIAKIIRKHKQIIVEGRDTGTKIIPNAQLKIYLEHDYDSRIRNVKNAEDKDLLLRLLKWRDDMDSKRKVDPFVMPEGASVFNNSYLSKKLASQLLMQNIIIPKLNELNVSTSKYKCDEDEKKDASSSSKVISQKKVNVKKKITNIKNNSQQPVVIGKNIVKNSNVYLKKEAKDDSNSSTLVKVVLPTSLKDNK